jgi:hypothetical protein
VSLLATYTEARKKYLAEKLLRRKQRVIPSQARHQLRIDVQPNGICVATVHNKNLEIQKIIPTAHYQAAMAAALKEIHDHHLLKQNGALTITLWPETVHLRTFPIGEELNFPTATALEQRVLRNPTDLGLDPNCAYRVINPGNGQTVICLGIAKTWWEELRQSVPNGTPIGKYWGALTALDIINRHFQKALPTQGLILILMDATQMYYFHLENGQLCNIKTTPRSLLQQPYEVRRQLISFKTQEIPKALFITLSKETDDMQLLERQLGDDPEVRISTANTSDLLSSFPMLNGCMLHGVLPLALLQGGCHGKL